MDYNKIFKFVALIVVILFFSWLNSRKSVDLENNKNNKNNQNNKNNKNKETEGFTSGMRQIYNQNRRKIRHKIEQFKTKTKNTYKNIYKKYNAP